MRGPLIERVAFSLAMPLFFIFFISFVTFVTSCGCSGLSLRSSQPTLCLGNSSSSLEIR